jgi:hypothetical protein
MCEEPPNRRHHGGAEIIAGSAWVSAAAQTASSQIKAVIEGLVKEAECFVEDFDDIDLALLVGGTSKAPVVRDMVTRTCAKPVVHGDEVYFDEMLATVRGIGFAKDFSDLIIKRPPYTIELRATLADGSVVPSVIHQAFDKLHGWRQTFVTATPYKKEVELRFEHPVKTLEVFFISPSRQRQVSELPREIFAGNTRIRARLNVRACLSLEGDQHRSTAIEMPYFTQVGLRPPRPFNVKRLNAPNVYPDDN